MKTIKKGNVVSAINEAVEAQGTMLDACKKAAGFAAKQADAELGLKGNLDMLVGLYAKELAKSANVKALFKDALTLFLAEDTPVSLEVKKRGEDAKELHTTAGEAATMPKHAMRDAAKQVREANGMARNVPARSPKTPSAPKTVAPAEVIVDSKLTKDAWFEQLDALLKTPDTFNELKEHLKDNGIVMYRKAK